MKGITHQQMKLITAHTTISQGRLNKNVIRKARVHAGQQARFFPMLHSFEHMINLPSYNFDLISYILTKLGFRIEPAIIRQSSIKTRYKATRIGTMIESTCIRRKQIIVIPMLELSV